MSFKKIKVDAWDCHCEQCGHDWISRLENLPTHCPNKNCTNPSAWNKKEKRKYERKQKEPE